MKTNSRRITDIHFIEDSADEVFVAEILLQRDNVDVTIVHHEDTLGFRRYLLDHPSSEIDLVLIDMNLPGEKGVSVIKTLQKDNLASDAIIGVCSGSIDPKDHDLAIDMGARFFVGKPLDLSCLKKICYDLEEINIDVDASGKNLLMRTLK